MTLGTIDAKLNRQKRVRGTLCFCGTFSTRISTRITAKSHVPVETIWTVKCPFYAVLSNFLSHFHRVQDLGSDGIHEVGGLVRYILDYHGNCACWYSKLYLINEFTVDFGKRRVDL